jgi:CubicO group peptidase (beta-lactamase class C family)
MMTSRRQMMTGAAALGLLPGGAALARAPGMDSALDAAFATGGAPALAGMVVGPDGPLWTGARGVRQAGGGDPVTADDLWHLGSNTKAMTAALYGRLVDQGRARWGATLSELLPDVTMDPRWRAVPIEAVMGHVAGLAEDTAMGSAWLMTARDDPRSLVQQRRSLMQTMLAVPPAGTPGTFAYANANYVLLGAVIEQVTGQGWEEAMQAEVFGPLGITTGGFGAPAGDQPQGHRGGLAIHASDPGSDNPMALGPAGTVHIGLSDYGRFLLVFLTDGAGWITPASLSALTTAIGTGSPPYAGGWIVPPGQPWARGPALTHDGSNTMWYVSTWVAPGLGRAFVAVSNDAEKGRLSCQRLIPGLIRAI